MRFKTQIMQFLAEQGGTAYRVEEIALAIGYEGCEERVYELLVRLAYNGMITKYKQTDDPFQNTYGANRAT